MKIKPRKVKEIATFLKSECFGKPDVIATGINEIHFVEKGDIAFVDNSKYYDSVLSSLSSVIIIDKKVSCPEGKSIIVHKNPFKAFNQLLKKFSSERIISNPIIGKNSEIHETAFIDKNVIIGDNVKILANASIFNNTIIRNNVVIQSGSVIGGLGFYYKKYEGYRERLLSYGGVELFDFVEIGANTTIDKGITSNTVVGEHTKIDNLVQVGHDTKIGRMCIIAAQVGIAGCTRIGNNVTLWGQVGVPSDVDIEDNVVVLAQSGITRSLKSDATYFGSPALDYKKKVKELIYLKRASRG